MPNFMLLPHFSWRTSLLVPILLQLRWASYLFWGWWRREKNYWQCCKSNRGLAGRSYTLWILTCTHMFFLPPLWSSGQSSWLQELLHSHDLTVEQCRLWHYCMKRLSMSWCQGSWGIPRVGTFLEGFFLIQSSLLFLSAQLHRMWNFR
jgi:hypothetical protein